MRFSLKEEFRKHLGRPDFIAEKEPEPEPANGEIRTEEVTTDPRASGLSNIGPEFKEAHVGHPNDEIIRIAPASFESRESTPTSPYNVSSPMAQEGNTPYFLSVQSAPQLRDHSPNLTADENFKRERNKSALTPGQLGELRYALDNLIAGLLRDRKAGLSVDERDLRMSSSSNTDCKVFEIPSILGGHSVSALGDYCAKRNFMKEDYAKQLGLHIDRQATSTVIIGSGKKIVTTGTARTSFRFKDEKEEYALLFHILPTCVHDVILGKGFLKITKTFSNLANKARRVKERLLKGISQHHLFYLGEYAPRFQGLVNGVPQEALADSGARVLIMDEDYARSQGLPIASGKDHQTRLIFADGSTASTCGMAFGVEWEFGHTGDGARFVLDFHILRNAPANVILSDQFLFGTEAFSQYECFLVDDDDEDDAAFFFAIDIDETHPGQVRLDMSSLSNKNHAEIVLRGEIEDKIADLPPEEQAEAWRREDERRAQWEQDFAALQRCLSTLAQTASTSISSSSSSTGGGSTQPLMNGSTPTVQTVSAGRKRSRWLLKFKRKVSS